MASFKVGDNVVFGRPNGEQTLGVVVKVNPTRLKVRTLEGRGQRAGEGQEWGVPPSLCRLAGSPVGAIAGHAAQAAPKRDDAAILKEILGCYCALSPEALTCDGELSRSQVAVRRTRITARLRELEREMGRRVSEDEAYRSLTARG